MLSALNAKAKLQHLKPEVWQGFVEDLKRTQRYNLIFIPSGSFGHLIDPLVLTNMLKEVGFKEIKTIKAFDRSRSPEDGDSSIVYECRK